MVVSRKTIISEVEDAIRARAHSPGPPVSDNWPRDRAVLVRDAAWLIILIERGDREYAAEAEAEN